MPLYKTIHFDSSTQILVWKITESYEKLFAEVQLSEKSLLRLNGMKSQLRQREFLSIRKLLNQVGYSDFDLHYDESGKPFLNKKKDSSKPFEVSITHSNEFSAIIISIQKVGIDIEMQREKIIRIADKFVNNKDLFLLKNTNLEEFIKKLTVKWGAKEAIFKIRNEPRISFKDHIWINSFEIEDKKTTAVLEMENSKLYYSIYFEEMENFTLVYAFEIDRLN